MRIKTIKRNTNYLLKMIDDFALLNINEINRDLKELDIRSKQIRRSIADMDIFYTKNGKMPAKYNEFLNALDTVTKLVSKKYNVLSAHDVHNKHIQNQICLQSDMAIR